MTRSWTARWVAGVCLLGCVAQGCRQDSDTVAARAGSASSEGLSATSFGFPAEWEQHESTWFQWWTVEYGTPDSTIQDLLVEMIRHTARSELVDLVVQNADERASVSATLSAAGVDVSRVRFHEHAHNDIWARDYGPQFVRDRRGGRGILDTGFNFYGYDTYASDFAQTDDRLDRAIAGELQLPSLRCGLIHEGGNIESDGRGTVVATETVLRRHNRYHSLADIEHELRRCYGARQVIFTREGLREDDSLLRGRLEGGVFNPGGTDGHTDGYVRFAPNGTILLAEARREDLQSSDPGARGRALVNQRRMEENYRILSRARDADGRPYRIVRVPLAAPNYYDLRPGDTYYDLYVSLSPYEDGTVVNDGDVLKIVTTSSYLNYSVTNDAVLMPSFCPDGGDTLACRRDREVASILGRAFPGRRVIPLRHTLAANRGAGGPHCMTQQQPKVD